MFTFPNICRLCTQNINLRYSLEVDHSNLIEKLTTLAPNTVESNDILPRTICQDCYNKVNESYKFQQQIYHTFKIFKTFLNYLPHLHQNLNVKTELFEFANDILISDNLKQFFNSLINSSNESDKGFTNSSNYPPEIKEIKLENDQEHLIMSNEEVKRRRGQPKNVESEDKNEFKQAKSEDADRIKNIVNLVESVDQEIVTNPHAIVTSDSTKPYVKPLIINLRKRPGRPCKPDKIKNRSKTVKKSSVEASSISEADNKVELSTSSTKNKKITRIGAIQSEIDPYEYTYKLPYDPTVSITYISNKTDKFYFCKSCNKQYCDFSSLRKHFVQHSEIKIFQCSLCDYETFTKHCLDTHQVVHLETRSEICQKCGKSFKSKDRLHRHSYCHIKRFMCDICGKEFSHSAMLRKHVLHVHINERNFICSVCGFGAKSQEYLKRHMHKHDNSDENKIECMVCKKLLKTRNSFKIHMKRHKDDRKFACTICDKKYVVKSQLDIHFRIHTGFKPYVCSYCGKQFRKTDPFKNHIRIHTNEKPYVCNYCNKSFTQKVSLQVHLKLHLADRPYTCKTCGKSFIRKSLYKIHLKTDHTDVGNLP